MIYPRSSDKFCYAFDASYSPDLSALINIGVPHARTGNVTALRMTQVKVQVARYSLEDKRRKRSIDIKQVMKQKQRSAYQIQLLLLTCSDWVMKMVIFPTRQLWCTFR